MLQDNEKQLIRDCMDALRRGIPGFRARRPQLEMVATVANTLARCRGKDESLGDGSHIAVIEAGTGTGKSFGALVPALVMAKARGKKLVVSSSTVALQEQYAQKDAPTLQRLLPLNFTFAMAKGRRRYVCPAKLEVEAAELMKSTLAFKVASSSGELFEAGEGQPPARDEAQVRRSAMLLRMSSEFSGGRWGGDRDELQGGVEDAVWLEVSTDRQGCSAKGCRDYQRCPFYAAKQRIKDADLVIANHDLVLSSLDSDANTLLPPASSTLLVLDEAHSLADKAVEHCSARHAVRGASEWVAGAVEWIRDAAISLNLDPTLYRSTQIDGRAAVEALDSLYARIHATGGFDEKRARRFRSGPLPSWVVSHGEEILIAAEKLAQAYENARQSLLEKTQADSVLATRVLGGLGFYSQKIENMVETWRLLLAEDAVDGPVVARWIERVDTESSRRDYLVCAAPISGAEKLRGALWSRVSGAILASATMQSCGSIKPFMRQVGLSGLPKVAFLQVQSPFDYQRQAKLVIAGMASDPADAEAHTQEVIERLPSLINTRGTLVLFTSAKQMAAVHAKLPSAVQALILMQGDLPKTEMLEHHRRVIDQGGTSVLFGLQSLAEGVDLPGEYCTHLICAKLPFPVPDTPLEEARREWLEAQGRSAFVEVTLPETSVRLKQQLGRLLRTVDDWGTATLLDRRLVTKRWGGKLLRGLPDFALEVEKPGRALSTAGSLARG